MSIEILKVADVACDHGNARSVPSLQFKVRAHCDAQLLFSCGAAFPPSGDAAACGHGVLVASEARLLLFSTPGHVLRWSVPYADIKTLHIDQEHATLLCVETTMDGVCHVVRVAGDEPMTLAHELAHAIAQGGATDAAAVSTAIRSIPGAAEQYDSLAQQTAPAAAGSPSAGEPHVSGATPSSSEAAAPMSDATVQLVGLASTEDAERAVLKAKEVMAFDDTFSNFRLRSASVLLLSEFDKGAQNIRTTEESVWEELSATAAAAIRKHARKEAALRHRQQFDFEARLQAVMASNEASLTVWREQAARQAIVAEYFEVMATQLLRP